MSNFADWARMRTQSPQLIVDALFARDLSAERIALQLRQSEVALRRTRAILQCAADSREASERDKYRAVLGRARAALLNRTPCTLTASTIEHADATTTSFTSSETVADKGTPPIQP
jgi:hypothetical protein